MKNKNIKGFTLIELLAVIVILGVLIGIAFPSISSRIRETRDKTYTLHEADMKTATMNLMSECVEKGEECVPNGESRTYYLSELIARKYSEGLRDPEDTDNYCDEEKSYVVVKNDSDNLSNFEYEVCLVCSNYESEVCKENHENNNCENIDDSEGPDCGEVTGGSTIWTNSDRVISVGCKDKGGCGCSQDVYYKRFSETIEKGQIEIKDRKGNTTICPVNVYIDKNKPECELEVIGTMGENGWYGNEAPIVRFKSKTDSESGIESYGLGTSSKEYNFNREDKYTVPRGIVTIYGYVRDNAGNVGTCHTNTIHYDDVVPTITNVRYGYQVYPKEDMASVSGNTISINNITSEYGTIYGAYIYFNGNVSGNSSISNGNTSLASRTLSGVNKMEYTFNGGAYNNIKITIPNASSVKRVELLTGESNTSYYTNKDVTIYINSHDSYSGKAYYTFDGKTYQTDNYKTYTKNTSGIVVGVKDYAGNKGKNQTAAINNIDKEKPNCSITQSGNNIGVKADGSNLWYNSNIGISLDRVDKTGGVTRYYNLGTVSFTKNEQYNISSTSNGKYNKLDKGTQTVDTGGQNWYGYVIDKAGNISSCGTVAHKDTVQPPCSLKVTSGTMGENSWYVSDVTIGFANKEDVLSKTYQYDVTGSSSASYNNAATKKQTKDIDGVTYYGYVKDKAGNTSSCKYTFKKDATKPECKVYISSGTKGKNNWYTSNVGVTFSSKTDNLSGIGSYGVGGYNGNNTGYLTKDTKGTYVTGYVKDKAGNTNSCSVYAKRDTVNPTCSLSLSGTYSNGWYRSEHVYISFSRSDATSGIANYGMGGNGVDDTVPASQCCNGWSYAIHTNDTRSVTWYGYVLDNAGHYGSCSINFKKDSTPPSCGTTSITTNNATGGVSGSTGCNDGLSGCVDNGPFSNLKGNKNITIKDKAGNTANCNVKVKSQRQKASCNTYNTKKDKNICGSDCTPGHKYTCVSPVGGGTSDPKTGCYSSQPLGMACQQGASCCVGGEKIKSCQDPSFGCARWGRFSDVTSCTEKKNEIKCQTIYEYNG